MAIVFGKSVIFSSSARTSSENSDDQVSPDGARGVRLYLDISARSGTSPTLDVKVQAKDSLSGNYVDISGGAFAQKNATGTDDLIIYPSVAAVSNRRVGDHIPRDWRVVGTIGGSSTPTFTYTVLCQYLG